MITMSMKFSCYHTLLRKKVTTAGSLNDSLSREGEGKGSETSVSLLQIKVLKGP